MMLSEQEVHRHVEYVGMYFDEAEGCAAAGRFLAACVMIGAALEAGLLALVGIFEDDLRQRELWPPEKETDPEGGLRKRPPETWHLMELVRLARRAGWLPAQIEGSDVAAGDEVTEAEVDQLFEFVNEVRNTAAHPGKHLRKSREILDLAVGQNVYEAAYEIVRAAFSYTHQTVLMPAAQTAQDDRPA